MPRRSPLLPALVAVAATAMPVLLTAGSAAAAPAAGASVQQPTAVALADGDDPLEVRINTLSPAYVPRKGKLRMTGSITNVSDERWRAINVHAFIDDQPLTSSADLAATSTTPDDADVGDRITIPGTFDAIGSLAPGETAGFSVQLARDELPVSQGGAYWFGAHALGNTTEIRDGIADGRARTLLPLVPPEAEGRERAAIVIPIRRTLRHAANGRIRSSGRWAADLGVGGRLRTLTDFGAASGSAPVTWLVDPAVPDAVAHLVEGNLPRDLGDTTTPTPGGRATTGPSPSPGAADPGEEDNATPEAPANPAAEPGASWLTRFQAALAGDQVLALPYGDPDVAAIATHAPDFYDLARRRGGTQLDRWRVSTEPAVAAPDGFLSAPSLSMLHGDETVLLSDEALGSDEVRTSATVEDLRVLFSSAATARGGPSPGEPLSELALRQRFLAEAAVRLQFHERTPLLLVLPSDFAPQTPSSFWTGLDAPWLELTGTDDLGPGRRLNPGRLTYPVEQELTELDPENFDAAEELIAAGRTLDTVLPLNDEVAGQVLKEALTSLSYSERDRTIESRQDTQAATAWIDGQLERVRLRAPRGVTLSSALGSFATTVTNRLDQPVTVVLRARSLGEIEVEASDPIELAADSRQTILLKTDATTPGVHYVRVVVTDEDGHPLGASQRVAIRSAQVSGVIWVIIGAGVGLLFLAIVIRVVRRIRRERA